MPYIDPTDRKRYDKAINALTKAMGEGAQAGHLNYIVSRLLWAFLGKKPKYARYNEAMGALTCAAFEFYRRKVAPYEDGKIEENGDLPSQSDLNTKIPQIRLVRVKNINSVLEMTIRGKLARVLSSHGFQVKLQVYNDDGSPLSKSTLHEDFVEDCNGSKKKRPDCGHGCWMCTINAKDKRKETRKGE